MQITQGVVAEKAAASGGPPPPPPLPPMGTSKAVGLAMPLSKPGPPPLPAKGDLLRSSDAGGGPPPAPPPPAKGFVAGKGKTAGGPPPAPPPPAKGFITGGGKAGGGPPSAPPPPAKGPVRKVNVETPAAEVKFNLGYNIYRAQSTFEKPGVLVFPYQRGEWGGWTRVAGNFQSMMTKMRLLPCHGLYLPLCRLQPLALGVQSCIVFHRVRSTRTAGTAWGLPG